jgi:hypothetical protein
MMWRKQYRTKRERRIDRVTGFIACFVVTALSFVGQQVTKEYMPISDDPFWERVRLIGLSLPWLLTILFISIGLYARPEFGLGYLNAIWAAIVIPLVLSAIFFAACFVGVIVGAPFLLLGGVGGLIALLVTGLGFLRGVIWVAEEPLSRLDAWWHEPEDEVLPREKAWVPVPDITWENDVPEGKGGNDEVA